jgi:WhiB family redox-sensing transcriptional regulator
VNWRDRAACRRDNTNHWFADETARSARYAKSVCSTCPVQTECLEYAIENDIPFGIWGAKTPRERSMLVRWRGR